MELIDEYDYLVVIDADALITNHTIKIESFLVGNYSLFLTQDINGINTGIFIVKCNSWIKSFVYYIIGALENFDCEQNVIEDYMSKNPDESKIKILTHPSINSVPYDFYSPSYGKLHYQQGQVVQKPTHTQGDWQEGDFVMHLPGMPLNKRLEIFNQTTVIK